jgi:hypothetical protein
MIFRNISLTSLKDFFNARAKTISLQDVDVPSCFLFLVALYSCASACGNSAPEIVLSPDHGRKGCDISMRLSRYDGLQHLNVNTAGT